MLNWHYLGFDIEYYSSVSGVFWIDIGLPDGETGDTNEFS